MAIKNIAAQFMKSGRSLIDNIFKGRTVGQLGKEVVGSTKKAVRETRRRANTYRDGGLPLDESLLKTAKQVKMDKVAGRVKKIYHTKSGALGRGALAAGRAVAFPVKFAVNNPIKTGVGLGMIHGVGSHIASLADQRTMQYKKPGMKHNQLGTDGLTLSLSRMRHR